MQCLENGMCMQNVSPPPHIGDNPFKLSFFSKTSPAMVFYWSNNSTVKSIFMSFKMKHRGWYLPQATSSFCKFTQVSAKMFYYINWQLRKHKTGTVGCKLRYTKLYSYHQTPLNSFIAYSNSKILKLVEGTTMFKRLE